jgi:molybdate transport system substrate-binding protein
MRRNHLFLFNKIFLALLLCSTPGALLAQPHGALTVYAAASLKDALDVLLKARETQGHGRTTAVYAASSTLARQIEHGAPADLFIAADSDWMDHLAQRKLLRDGTRVNLLSNRLALIAPSQSKTELTIAPNFALDAVLGKHGRLAIADPASVPAGRYGKAALQALGVWHALSQRLAPTENVRAALMLVARGEAPLGIVYTSDAQAEPRVRVVGVFPAHTHAPIVYPAAVLAQSRAAGAQALLDDLRGSDARTLWRKFGFGMAP